MAGSALAGHWDEIYRQRAPGELTWYQREPLVSLALLDMLGVTPDQAVVDVGGGTSSLAGHLLDRGFGDITVLDLSTTALASAAGAMGERSGRVHWLAHDVLTWRPDRRYQVWHDRAVLHFLVDEGHRLAYLATLRAALDGGGAVVVGTFAADGPERCSGLPVRRYGPDDLATLFGPAFDVVEQRREEHHTPAGGVQPFTWAAMRMAGDPEGDRIDVGDAG